MRATLVCAPLSLRLCLRPVWNQGSLTFKEIMLIIKLKVPLLSLLWQQTKLCDVLICVFAYLLSSVNGRIGNDVIVHVLDQITKRFMGQSRVFESV